MEIVRSLGEAVNLNRFNDEIHGLPPLEKFININVISNIAEINNQQVGLVQPESTPVEIPLAGYLMHEGISYVLLKQEPPIL